jgi:glutamine synthetase
LGYFPCPPTDSFAELRTEIAGILAECGIPVTNHHHELATGGQCEIDLGAGDLLRHADHLMLAKYIVRNAARRAGKTATFMPKPLYEDNGSGLHTYFSLYRDEPQPPDVRSKTSTKVLLWSSTKSIMLWLFSWIWFR